MAEKKKRYSIDWDYWRHKFVSGAMDLKELSFDFSQVPGSPAYQSLKNKALAENWKEQRKQYKYQSSTAVLSSAIGEEAVRQTEQLVDAAEVITRHIKLAKSLQGAYLSLQPKIQKALAQADLEELSPKELTGMLKDLTSILTSATDIERKAMGLSDPMAKAEITINDISAMTDEELQRIASGESASNDGN